MLCLFLTSVVIAAAPASTPDPSGPVLPNPQATASRSASDTGRIWFDARVPAEVSLDGSVLAQLFVSGELQIEAAVGSHDLKVVRNGEPETLRVEVPAQGAAVVLVGRNGTSTGFRNMAPAAPVSGEAAVDVRVMGNEPLQLRVDAQRLQISPGDILSMTLTAGSHRVSVRNADGTAIFATGSLLVDGRDEPAVLQIAAGRLPETSGAVTFQASR